MATVVAEASVVARGSGSCGSALLIVNGISGSSLFAQPKASEPVSCVRRANFVYPAALIVCSELDGHKAIRPCPGSDSPINDR